MPYLPVNRLGAQEISPKVMQFGIFLPGISATDGYSLSVKIIHKHDQFLQDIAPLAFPLVHSIDPTYGDYWSGTVDIAQQAPQHANSHWGQPGQYVYRYALATPQQTTIDWIIDPFAREFGVGNSSAVTLSYKMHPWSQHEAEWKIPALRDLVVYELQLNEFAGGLDDTIEQLDYLQDLGVNCLELMPVSNLVDVIQWGYEPIGYFGVDERFGQRERMQHFVDQAHQRGIAVVIDSVYEHTDARFPYVYLYNALGFASPFAGPFAEEGFPVGADFTKAFTRDFFLTVNQTWLDIFHVDGFRYDYVPGYYIDGTDVGYPQLVRDTYQMVKGYVEENWPYWTRFAGPDGEIRLIQCSEHLGQPNEMLNQTYTNCCWQDGTLQAATAVANGQDGAIDTFAEALSHARFTERTTLDGVAMPRMAFQYIETHDHSRFICNFGLLDTKDHMPALQRGDRDNKWFKVQPYLIALLTAKGIPMLWQGQEFCLDYYVIPYKAEGDISRVKLFRPVKWNYFYDAPGHTIINLVRRLLKIRNSNSQFRSDNFTFYGDPPSEYQYKGILLFSREDAKRCSLVAVNFTDDLPEKTITFPAPYSGEYQEELHGVNNIPYTEQGSKISVSIPSNYGCIWTVQKT